MRCLHALLAAPVAALLFMSTGTALGQPLPTDPRLVTGELDNGLTYIVRRHANPPDRAAMWLHVSTGSLNETDRQRGISHYLEHMAFNGSENFAPGTVVNFFQSMGLKFGADQNAFTGFDQTAYQLTLPDAKAETLDKGLTFFADVAGRLSLLPEEINEERQVILEEKRTRAGGQQRVSDYVLERLIPGSLLGERLPIGIDETLLKLEESDFKTYYGQWYVPSNMTLTVVADADPAPIVEQIKKHFSFGNKQPRPVDQDAKVRPYTECRAIVASDPEITRASIEIIGVGAKEPATTTVPQMRRDLVRQIAVSAFNRRMVDRISRGDTAYLSARAGASNQFNLALLKQVSVEGKPEDWKRLLTEIGTDVQRARLHGFSQTEIDDVKKEITSSLEQYVAQESTMPAAFLLRSMNNSIASGEPIMSAQQELDVVAGILPGITPEQVSREFAELFDPRAVTFIATLPSGGDVPADEQLLVLGKAAFEVTPDAETQAERPDSLLSKLPKPGVASDLVTHAASDVTSGWLDNGVRFHHRFMDIRKDQVTVTITLAAGAIQETAANRGIAEVAGLAWGRPATSTLTSTNIRDIRTGRKTTVRGGAGLDTMNLSVSGSPSDLEDGLQLAYLLLTDPVIEPARFEQWKKQTLESIEDRDKDLDAAMGAAVAQALFPSNETRLQPITAEQVERLSVDAAQAWLRNAIATAPIEVAVVGDVSKDRAVELLSRYIGSLPRRDRIGAATLDGLRSVERAAGPRTADRRLETTTDKAVVLTGFFTADAENVRDSRCMTLASQLLSTRVLDKIREKEQLAYSPGCRNQPGTAIPGYGLFMGATDTDPAKVERLVSSYNEIFDAFSAAPATDDEMTTVRKQFANEIDRQMKEPGFWVQRISAMDYRDTSLDDLMAAAEAYQTISAEDIRTVFNKYHKPEGMVTVIVRPATPAKAVDKDGPGAAH